MLSTGRRLGTAVEEIQAKLVSSCLGNMHRGISVVLSNLCASSVILSNTPIYAPAYKYCPSVEPQWPGQAFCHWHLWTAHHPRCVRCRQCSTKVPQNKYTRLLSPVGQGGYSESRGPANSRSRLMTDNRPCAMSSRLTLDSRPFEIIASAHQGIHSIGIASCLETETAG